MNAPRAPFSVAACLRQADDALAFAPRWQWTRRVPARGERAARFVVPLEYCQTSNARMRGGVAARRVEAVTKQRCFEMMFIQNGGRKAKAPLSGRPMIRAIRFSSRETDVTSDWSKVPVDRLQVGKLGLGFLVDDSPRFCDVHTWCEYAPPGRGFVLVEVWTG